MTYILIVEDDRPSSDLIERILSRLQWEVRCVSTAEAGLGLAQEAPPCLAIIDIHLPIVDGFWLVDQFKACPLLQNIPTLILTADSNNDIHNRLLSLGCDAVMTKPYSYTDLIDTIKQLLDTNGV
jgi:DNA-binding response OmpR family regulator